MTPAATITPAMRAQQVWTVARLQLTRVFFSKRSFWVYGLAIFPSVIFVGHGIEVKLRAARWSRSTVEPAIMQSIREGESDEDILKRAPTPVEDFTFTPRGRARGKFGKFKNDGSFQSGPARRYLA